MKQMLTAIILALVLALGLTGCGSASPNDEPPPITAEDIARGREHLAPYGAVVLSGVCVDVYDNALDAIDVYRGGYPDTPEWAFMMAVQEAVNSPAFNAWLDERLDLEGRSLTRVEILWVGDIGDQRYAHAAQLLCEM